MLKFISHSFAGKAEYVAGKKDLVSIFSSKQMAACDLQHASALRDLSRSSFRMSGIAPARLYDLLFFKELVASNNGAYNASEIAPLMSQRSVELLLCVPPRSHISTKKRPVQRSILAKVASNGCARETKGHITSSLHVGLLNNAESVIDVLDQGVIKQDIVGGDRFIGESFNRLTLGDAEPLPLLSSLLIVESFFIKHHERRNCRAERSAEPDRTAE